MRGNLVTGIGEDTPTVPALHLECFCAIPHLFLRNMIGYLTPMITQIVLKGGQRDATACPRETSWCQSRHSYQQRLASNKHGAWALPLKSVVITDGYFEAHVSGLRWALIPGWRGVRLPKIKVPRKNYYIAPPPSASRESETPSNLCCDPPATNPSRLLAKDMSTPKPKQRVALWQVLTRRAVEDTQPSS